MSTPGRPGRPTPLTRRRGFTLIEVAFVLAIIGVLLAAAVPSYANYLARQRLRHVAELLELDLRRARTVSVEESSNVYISFESGPQWCWGSSRVQPCNCNSGAPRCEMGGASASDHQGVLLQAGRGITFEANLGRALGWNRIGLSNQQNHQLHLDLNPLGRPQICGTDARKGKGGVGC